MTNLIALEESLIQLEAHEPELAREFRASLHLMMLGLGRNELNQWDAWPLSFLSSGAQSAAFDYLLSAINPPASLKAAIVKSAQATPAQYYWHDRAIGGRVEHVRLAETIFEINYGDGSDRHRLRLIAPALAEPQKQGATEWLSQEATLRAIAKGAPLREADLRRLGLVPAWDSVIFFGSSSSQAALALGLTFFFRALAIYPAYLLIWRGLGGPQAIGEFVEQLAARKQRDFEAAIADLPSDPETFWAAPELPALPALQAVVPEAGLGAHLPPPDFWPTPEENKIFAEAMAKVYKNAPKKLFKIVERGY
ncbi:MAG: hypothetical protein HY260_03670 [Chloroflexi bacterium]|nr:hypothetical protein [Chloroflexota bacterium]